MGVSGNDQGGMHWDRDPAELNKKVAGAGGFYPHVGGSRTKKGYVH